MSFSHIDTLLAESAALDEIERVQESRYGRDPHIGRLDAANTFDIEGTSLKKTSWVTAICPIPC
jgi:hypothetical protein